MESEINEDKRSHHMCELCNRVIIGDREWAGRIQRAGKYTWDNFNVELQFVSREQNESIDTCSWSYDLHYMISGFLGLFTAL